jgi:hypothetical protein
MRPAQTAKPVLAKTREMPVRDAFTDHGVLREKDDRPPG